MISTGGTSRSTRWRRRSRPTTSARSSIRTAAAPISSSGAVRVLHDVSFVDDPTRILRGITLRGAVRVSLRRAHRSARSRLHRDRATSATCRRRACATSWSRCSTIPERRTESADSASSAPTLRSIRSSAETTRRLRCSRARPRCGTSSALDVPSWRLGLAALARAMTADEAYGLARPAEGRPQARRADRRRGHRRAADRRAAPLRASSTRRRSSRSPIRSRRTRRSLALALDDRRELRDYFERLRNVRLEIGGADLIALGLPESPQIGEILAEIRTAEAQRRAGRARGGARGGARARRREHAARDGRERGRDRRALRARSRRGRPGRDRRRGDQVRDGGGDVGARGGRRRGRGGEPRAGPRAQARALRRRVPLALHRAPAVEQGQGRERALRARPLARLRLGGATPRPFLRSSR